MSGAISEALRLTLTPEQVANLATAQARSDLTAWERGFLDDLATRRRPLSDRQAATLARCARGRPDYDAINRAAMARLPDVLARLLPGGRIVRHEYEAADLRGGEGSSLRVNLRTGKWADFNPAADAKGGDPVSLAAAVTGLPMEEAAHGMAAMLGMGAMHRG